MCLRHVAVLLSLAVLLSHVTFAQTSRQGGDTRPDLYYFVVDRSGSIKTRGLVDSIRGALVKRLGTIAENAEVRIVLFNQKADRRASWRGIDVQTTGRIDTWLNENFKPQGDTRLFDTVAEAFEEINRDQSSFERVQLIVLSDGVEEPPISVKYRSWQELEPLSAGLKQSKPYYFCTWYTLGFDPPQKPDPSSGIMTEVVPNPVKGIEIKEPVLAIAKFSSSPLEGRAPLAVEFKDETEGKVAGYSWDFGDGETSDERNPRHIYTRAAEYKPRLTVRNPDGSYSKSSGDILIKVAAPLPWWLWPAVWLGGALLLWIVIVVPLLRRWRLPHRNVSVHAGTATYWLLQLARRRRFQWLWPRGSIPIGSAGPGAIQLQSPGVKGAVARIDRLFSSRTYLLIPLVSGAVMWVTRAGTAESRRELKPGSRNKLQDGAEFEVSGRRLVWRQPAGRRP